MIIDMYHDIMVYQPLESKLTFESFVTMVTFQLLIIKEIFLNHIGLLLCKATVILNKF